MMHKRAFNRAHTSANAKNHKKIVIYTDGHQMAPLHNIYAIYYYFRNLKWLPSAILVKSTPKFNN